MSIPFNNNLEKNDRVYDTVSKRQGKVARDIRDPSSRRVCILLDGDASASAKYVDVMQLRLMPDGRTPEQDAPVDGVPPVEEPKRAAVQPRAHSEEPDALSALRSELERNNTEMNGMNARFKFLKEKNEKLVLAISALTS